MGKVLWFAGVLVVCLFFGADTASAASTASISVTVSLMAPATQSTTIGFVGWFPVLSQILPLMIGFLRLVPLRQRIVTIHLTLQRTSLVYQI